MAGSNWRSEPVAPNASQAAGDQTSPAFGKKTSAIITESPQPRSVFFFYGRRSHSLSSVSLVQMSGGQPDPTTAKGDKVVIYARIDVAVDKFYGNGRVVETDSSGRVERAWEYL
ncbi:hypothetical protein RRG08_055220 [Elysia crispata]|uniref:Uncharacterized protein n=1 Tax=Elysia crispata TaxID=231223 RepID=A0AAE0XTL9_9GAST|nr:hypothetical protein RRG08_055220 [Elysia crispata]